MCFSVKVETKLERIKFFTDSVVDQDSKKQYESLLEFQDFSSKEDLEELLGLKPSVRRKMPILKPRSNDGLVYSNYFAPVVSMQESRRIISPMRYRVRPKGSATEIPTKYNVFNARLDSLEKRDTWKALFMKNHAVFLINSFYEWVERDGKKSLISFFPENRLPMLVPCLYDEWASPCGKLTFKSFAIITSDPTKEILQMGHDRAPIVLNRDSLSQWLSPNKFSIKDTYKLLNSSVSHCFSYQWA